MLTLGSLPPGFPTRPALELARLLYHNIDLPYTNSRRTTNTRSKEVGLSLHGVFVSTTVSLVHRRAQMFVLLYLGIWPYEWNQSANDRWADIPTTWPLAMSDLEVVEYHHYCPEGVQRVLASGTSAFIGEVDESTVLKYPLEPGGDMSRLKHEYKIFSIFGQHVRIIGQKGLTDVGLYLERATNETIHEYLTEFNHTPTVEQRVAWCREVTEAVDYIHSKGVIHCYIQSTNILVDESLHLKLSDFQGNYVLETGEVVDGWCGEPCRYFCPREDDFEASVQTDLFALGSTIYFIMTSHEVFPDIVGGEDKWQDKIQARFTSGVFPTDSHPCDVVMRKCWHLQYISASEALDDIRAVEKGLVGAKYR